ncbi:MAG: aminotransferase class I/II-fold pyridoxal phosphate-dependent enzyme [Bacteroidales bacterium]|nr:aminotransferase class I/II-fold pyridoxal phosphate-dependent enzyme [Bacteroidales bacterium]
MNISNRVNQLKKSAIHEMTRLSKQYEDVAFLSWAKPSSGTPSHINDAAVEAIQNGLTSGYSQAEGLPELRELIVRKLKRDNHINSKISELLITVGAIEGLAASVMAVIDPGDEVILLTPTYSTHITQVKLASGIPILVPLDEENDFKPNFEAIVESITKKTKAIMLCTPNNPTGTVFSEDNLKTIAKIALKNKLTVIVDEAYEYFVYDDNKHFSIASIPGMENHVITNYTFTKTYAMTGWRIGYLHASENLIEQIKKVHIPISICAPVVSQYAAIAALKGSQDCIKEFRNDYLRARNLMCERLDRLDSFFQYVKPSGSYLMFPEVLGERAKDSFAFSKTLLKEAKVSTTPGVAFGPNGENHVRLSFCVPDDMINKAFDRIEFFFKG